MKTVVIGFSQKGPPIKVDENLIRRAEQLATGANIHDINSLKSAYTAWCELGAQEQANRFKRKLVDLLISIGSAASEGESNG